MHATKYGSGHPRQTKEDTSIGKILSLNAELTSWFQLFISGQVLCCHNGCHVIVDSTSSLWKETLAMFYRSLKSPLMGR
jgi:hypothetical protein